jgi:hypothetical protein
MRTKSRIRSLAYGMVGLAALAISGTGCIIESSGGSCLPDLFVPWEVVQNVQGDPLITCAEAGATSVDLDVNGQTYTQACSANATGGQFVVPLADSGSYTLDAFLLAPNGGVISEAHPPTISVSCAGATTPVIVLPVNL